MDVLSDFYEALHPMFVFGQWQPAETVSCPREQNLEACLEFAFEDENGQHLALTKPFLRLVAALRTEKGLP